MPDPGKRLQAIHEAGHAFFRVHVTPGNFRRSRGDIRPVSQLVPVLERKIEQGGQHLGGEINRHPVHPVKGFSHRQVVQYVHHAAANQPLHFRQVLWRHHRLHRTPLHVVFGRVHGDKHLKGHILGEIADDDGGFRGKILVIAVHRHDVLEACY